MKLSSLSILFLTPLAHAIIPDYILAAASPTPKQGDSDEKVFRILPHPAQIDMSLPVIPSDGKKSPPSTDTDVPASGPIISDVLPISKSLSIFVSLLRDSAPAVLTRIEDSGTNTTLLVPPNSVMQKLPRKPWEEKEGVLVGLEGEHRAQKNIERFVEAHVVGKSPWNEGEKVKNALDRELWWRQEGSDRIIYPDKIKVSKVQNEVANGQVWIVEGVVNYE